MQQTIYLNAKQHNVIHSPKVMLEDIGKWESSDKKLLDEVKGIPLHVFREKAQKKQMEFFSVLKVIELVHNRYPDAQVVNLGDKDFLVEYISGDPAPRWVDRLRLIVLCGLIFFGSAFTIMAFNNDVNITGVFSRFYTQVTGTEKPPIGELEISYSIGIAIGIVAFFNHLGRRKFSSDPTPIQVEVAKFKKDIDMTLIENAEREGHKQDVSE